MPCTADLERRDYLDFLPKRPQGTTKILGTPAFAGTKTPAVLKFSSKGATTDCVETPVNCPHCGQKWRLRRRLRRQPFILLSFSSSKKLQKAQETQSYQRFQHVGHTDFNTSGTNGPRSLSRAKVGTHSAFGEESHTAAHTAKHGPSGRGRYHYPRHVLHVHEHPRAGCQNGVLCRFGILARRCSRRTQKAFGTAMRLCVSLSRGVAAPLGCVIFFASAEVAACTPCAQCFPNVQDEGWYHYPRRALRAAETPDGRLSKRLICRFLASPIYICERPCRIEKDRLRFR